MKTLYVKFRRNDTRFNGFVAYVATLLDFNNVGSCDFWKSGSGIGCAAITVEKNAANKLSDRAKEFGAFHATFVAP